MIFYFFPAMTAITIERVLAAILIIHEEFASFPIGTFILKVVTGFRLSAEVLPIMAILALASIMHELVEWAEHSFEMENIKVTVFIQGVNQWHSYFVDSVRERTKYPVFAF